MISLKSLFWERTLAFRIFSPGRKKRARGARGKLFVSNRKMGRCRNFVNWPASPLSISRSLFSVFLFLPLWRPSMGSWSPRWLSSREGSTASCLPSRDPCPPEPTGRGWPWSFQFPNFRSVPNLPVWAHFFSGGDKSSTILFFRGTRVGSSSSIAWLEKKSSKFFFFPRGLLAVFYLL